jgi:hypothetical protein
LLAPVDLGRSRVEAGSVQEKIADGDCLRRWARRRTLLARYDDVLEFGDESGDGVVEGEATLFVQHHDRNRGDRPGHRVDPKQGSLAHRHARLHILNTDCFEVSDLPTPRDGRHRSGNPLLRDVAIQQFSCFTKASRRETGCLRTDARRVLRRRRSEG